MTACGRLAVGLLCCWILASCATTGDPRQGGLFGWSETKAVDRQRQLEATAVRAEGEAGREAARRHALESRNANAGRQLASAPRTGDRGEAELRAQQSALIAKTERLERASPTPALASRARAYREKVNEIAAQTDVSISERKAHLRELEAKVDSALSRTPQ